MIIILFMIKFFIFFSQLFFPCDNLIVNSRVCVFAIGKKQNFFFDHQNETP